MAGLILSGQKKCECYWKVSDRASRRWNSLCQLRDAIHRDGDERVISFNGHTLETAHWIYQLAHRELICQSKDGGRKRPPKKPS